MAQREIENLSVHDVRLLIGGYYCSCEVTNRRLLIFEVLGQSISYEALLIHSRILHSLIGCSAVQREPALTRHRHVEPVGADRRVQQRPVGANVAQRERYVAEGELAALGLLGRGHAGGAALGEV